MTRAQCERERVKIFVEIYSTNMNALTTCNDSRRAGHLLCLFSVVGLCTTLATAQADCGNPQTARIGIDMIYTSRPSDSVRAERAFDIASKLRAALAVKFGRDFCVVSDLSLFDKASNYPLLRGSLLIRIFTSVSKKRSDIAAVAIDIEAVQSPSASDSLHMATVPILVEADSDFDVLAGGVYAYYDSMARQMIGTDGKRTKPNS